MAEVHKRECEKGINKYPDNKVQGANMGPIWVLSAPDGPHIGPMNFAIWVCIMVMFKGINSMAPVRCDNDLEM